MSTSMMIRICDSFKTKVDVPNSNTRVIGTSTFESYVDLRMDTKKVCV